MFRQYYLQFNIHSLCSRTLYLTSFTELLLIFSHNFEITSWRDNGKRIIDIAKSTEHKLQRYALVMLVRARTKSVTAAAILPDRRLTASLKINERLLKDSTYRNRNWTPWTYRGLRYVSVVRNGARSFNSSIIKISGISSI